MKVALMVLGLLALLILAVIAIGAALPKHHIVTRSAGFRATPEKLFALISGPQTWRPDVKRFEPVVSADGRQMWRETYSDGQTIAYEVVEWRPPVLLKTRIATPDLPFGGAWTFAIHADNGPTTVRITEEGDVYNPLFRFVSRFIMGQTRSIDAYLINLAKATGDEVQLQD